MGFADEYQLRKSFGRTPYFFLKQTEKYRGEENPTFSEISTTDRAVDLSNFAALSKRYERRSSEGV